MICGPRSLLDRLPERLRGADLSAVVAEDHDLRLHTSLGSSLIKMRLVDALEELVAVDGARTHRSRRVARAAVMSVARARGRATLRLRGGLEAPVSRRYALALRDTA